MKKLLYVCDAETGGIAEYAIRQSLAIANAGVEVHFLCDANFPKERLSNAIKVQEFHSKPSPFWAISKLRTFWKLSFGQRLKTKFVCEVFNGSHFDAILFACYKEYFAPLWVGPLRSLARRGAVIGTIAHDPVRDFVVGPLWWHRWSVRLAYSFIRHVFVHDETRVDFGGKPPKGIQIHEIPHGPYEVAEPKIGRLEMRRRLGFSSYLTTEEDVDPQISQIYSELPDAPVSDSFTLSASGPASLPATSHPRLATPAPPDVVFLAFGQIRDGKNLDLFLRAMTRLPENVKLLVAGKGDSGSSRPPEFYQKLAEELGVAERCRWDIRKIPDEEVGDLFAACDVVLVTYSAKFRSASGVLNAAVSARKPVLASSGPGPLKKVVSKYHLGVFVEPDDSDEIMSGARQLLKHLSPPTPIGWRPYTAGVLRDWDRYEDENAWDESAHKVLSSIVN